MDHLSRSTAEADSPSTAAGQGPAQTGSSGAASAPQPQSRRVLVVDDNEDAATMLAAVVEKLGNEVRIAGDGVEAVELAGRFLPELVLMDIGMPRMDGHEAARRIRKEPWGRGMTLVALTGWGQDEDRQRSAEAGFDHHLVKPAPLATLRTLLAGEAP